MLQSLKIDNIAVIEKADLEFDEGLNILTGETGAGKSLIIDSINAVLGERTSRELIRNGCKSANVVACFEKIGSEAEKILEESGIEKTEDSSLTISRTISLNGKNSCRINGCPSTVANLKELGSALINIHGQHDNQSLLSADNHLIFIDRMAGNSELKAEYQNAFFNLKKVKKELDMLYDKRDDTLSRLDYIDFVIDEISRAEIHSGEIDELNKEKELIRNSSKIKSTLEKTISAITNENGIFDSLCSFSDELNKISIFNEKISEPANGIKGIALDLDDCCDVLKKISSNISFESGRLTEIDSRLDEIYKLSMKYGKNEDEILHTLDSLIAEKSEIESFDAQISELESSLFRYSDEVKKLSSKLTTTRKKTASVFEKKVKNELVFLDMPYVEFCVNLTPGKMSSKGAENIEFLISSNPDQKPGPISKIASGGELSRIMLAIKNVLSDNDFTDTLIFDEIDTGVSGSAAEKIALKLQEVSKNKQVICVTHLARIAAQADTHLKIKKDLLDGKTYTGVIRLDFQGRAEEIARITAGNDLTQLQIKTAEEMLKRSKGLHV